MAYPKQPTETQRKEALDQLLYMRRRELSAAAYVRDRADQYVTSSGSHVALMNVAAALERGEHFEALAHGELDDLVEEMMKPGCGRRPPQAISEEGKKA